MKKKLTIVALSLVTLISPLSMASNPSSVPDVVKTWAKALNKPVIWAAGSDYDGRMVQFEEFDASQPHGFERAFSALNALLEKAGDIPLTACFFNNALEIRRINQPDCSKPI